MLKRVLIRTLGDAGNAVVREPHLTKRRQSGDGTTNLGRADFSVIARDTSLVYCDLLVGSPKYLRDEILKKEKAYRDARNEGHQVQIPAMSHTARWTYEAMKCMKSVYGSRYDSAMGELGRTLAAALIKLWTSWSGPVPNGQPDTPPMA